MHQINRTASSSAVHILVSLIDRHRDARGLYQPRYLGRWRSSIGENLATDRGAQLMPAQNKSRKPQEISRQLDHGQRPYQSH